MDPATALASIGKFFGFLWKHKNRVVIGLLLVVIFFMNVSIKNKAETISKKDTEIGALTQEKKQLQGQLTIANDLIDKQNSSIQEYLAQADDLEFRLSKLQHEYTVMDSSLRTQINILLKRKPIPKECSGAMDWLRQRAIEEYGEVKP